MSVIFRFINASSSDMAFAERPASINILVPPQPIYIEFPDDPDDKEHVDISAISDISNISAI
jgi:hypothetical protein